MGFADAWRRKRVVYAALWFWAGVGLALLPSLLQLHLGDIFGGIPPGRLLFGPMRWVNAHSGLGPLAQVWLAAALAWLLLGALAIGFEWLASCLDRDDSAWSSLAWALRSWPAWTIWVSGAVVVTGIVFWALPGIWGLAAVVPAALALAMLPFLVFNADNVRPDRPARRWRMHWPGWSALGNAVVCTAVLYAADSALDLFEPMTRANKAGVAAAEIALRIVGVLLTTWWNVSWLERARASKDRALWRRILSARVVCAVTVQTLRYGVLGTLFAVPVLATVVATTFLVPQIEDSLQQRGAELSFALHAMFVASHWFSDWWWIAVLLLAWFPLVASARLLVALGLVQPALEGSVQANSKAPYLAPGDSS
jgi:hypothetical protein